MKINKAHVSLLSRAFKEDPLFVYLFTAEKYQKQSEALIRFILKQNQLSGGIILTDHSEKPSYVAIIDPPKDLRNPSVRAKVRGYVEQLLLLSQLPFSVLRFLTKYQKAVSQRAPENPHYYLTMLGVDPGAQGKGIGKKALEEIHEIADTSEKSYPVALDTENPENVAYYEKFGYQLIDTKTINGLTLYCLSRANNPADIPSQQKGNASSE
jgi:ribosomal protein S18 acetylase RimI-like enzyme